MKTLYRGAEGGIIILNAAVSAADGAVARANNLINNSPLNSLVNGVLRRSCTVTCKPDVRSHGNALFCHLHRVLHVGYPKAQLAVFTILCAHDDAGPNATANGTDSTTRLMAQLAEGASAAADVAAALPPSTRASASSLVQSAVKLASSFSPTAAGRQQVSAPEREATAASSCDMGRSGQTA